MIIYILRDKYSLSFLMKRMNISKSSYYYQHKLIHSETKYEDIAKEIIHLFHENNSRYSYRRIHTIPKKQNTIISEKIFRRIMKENYPVAKIKKTKKYSSYMGKISKAVENLINRNFLSDKPNQKIRTDITEFIIPAAKVYLSPIIDCFDRMVSAWKININLNAELVNSMLDEYHETLKNGEKPIVHSDCGVYQDGFQKSIYKKRCSSNNFAYMGFFGKIKNEIFYGRK